MATIIDTIEAVLAGREPAAGGALALAGELDRLWDVRVYPASFAAAGGAVYAAARGLRNWRFVVRIAREPVEGARELGPFFVASTRWTAALAAEMRGAFAFFVPVALGKDTSAGMGDRLGIATQGHVRAVRGTGIRPIFAQQSIREMTRTRRTPQDVMDDAAWGVFASGWREPWGSDADHLKTTEEVDRCAEAGFVMYTIDPGEHVDDAASQDAPAVLAEKLSTLPWGGLETTLDECRARHVRGDVTEEDFARAAVKYGRAVGHTALMARHIARVRAAKPFEIEVSVDETATPTTPFEHRFVITELYRMGVRPASVAVRFVGEFEKGIDYKGDLDVFRAETELHAEIAREFGGYKLSIHSGSDKFSVYPIIAKAARGAVHLKTAGTSYLEALRAVAEVDLDLFREIAAVAREHYDEDRKSYHVSGVSSDVPPADKIDASAARALLDHNGARQVFHTTYGSVLFAPSSRGGTLGEQIKDALVTSSSNEEVHYAMLERHFNRHLEAFARKQ